MIGTQVVWHYEGADPDHARLQVNELVARFQSQLSNVQVEVVKYDYNKILEVKPKGINKGVASFCSSFFCVCVCFGVCVCVRKCVCKCVCVCFGCIRITCCVIL
jgi:hypothetical protein